MSGKRYTREFRVEAFKQVTERGHPVAEVANRLEVTTHSLYEWVRKYSAIVPERQAAQVQETEIRKIKAELKRVARPRNSCTFGWISGARSGSGRPAGKDTHLAPMACKRRAA